MFAKFFIVKESEQIYYYFINFNFSIFFINNQGKQRKMLKRLNIYCYSYQVKKQLCHMNGVRVLTVSD